MKKKIIFLLAFVIILSFGMAIFVSNQSSRSHKNSGKEIDYSLLYEEIDFLAASNSVSDEELAAKATDEVIELTVLYNKATELGYTISEEEFENYKDELMESLDKAENKEEMLEFFDGFGGSESYFELMKNRLTMKLLIRKYLDDEKNKYANEEELIQNVISDSGIDDSIKDKILSKANEYVNEKLNLQ